MDDVIALPTIEISSDTPAPGGAEDNTGSSSKYPAGTVGVVNPLVVDYTPTTNTPDRASYSHRQRVLDSQTPNVPVPSHPFETAAINPSSIEPARTPSPFHIPRHIRPLVSTPYNDWLTPEEYINAIGLYGLVNVPIVDVVPADFGLTQPEFYGLTYQTPGLLFDYGQPSTPFVPSILSSEWDMTW